MGKKNKNRHSAGQSVPIQPALTPIAPVKSLISKRGWKIIGGGIGTLLIGYFILSLADPMGQNWASNVSPILILAGYAVIGIGIIAKDPAN